MKQHAQECLPISGHTVSFDVDEQCGTVRASIKGCSHDLFGYTGRKAPSVAITGLYSMMCALQDEMSACARCIAPDVFDVNTGKAIAYEKLKFKYWSKMHNASHAAALYAQRLLLDMTRAENNSAEEMCRAYEKYCDIGDIPGSQR